MENIHISKEYSEALMRTKKNIKELKRVLLEKEARKVLRNANLYNFSSKDVPSKF